MRTYQYNSFLYNLISGNINDLYNSDLKVALFNNDFNFNIEDRNLSDINLKNEINDDNYQKGGKSFNNIEIEKKGNSITLKGDSISWSNLNSSAYYALVYDNTQEDLENKKLLFCIDFEGEKESNYNNDFTIVWNELGLFSLNDKINRNNLTNDLWDFIEEPLKYKDQERVIIIRKNLDLILENEFLMKLLLSLEIFLKTIFKSEVLFETFTNSKLFLDCLVKYQDFFYNQSKNKDYKTPLQFLVQNSDYLARLSTNDYFAKVLKDNSEQIVNYIEDYYLFFSYILENESFEIDISKSKSYQVLIEEDGELKELFENSENVKM